MEEREIDQKCPGCGSKLTLNEYKMLGDYPYGTQSKNAYKLTCGTCNKRYGYICYNNETEKHAIHSILTLWYNDQAVNPSSPIKINSEDSE